MALDPALVSQALPAAVPMVGTLGLEFVEVTADRAVLRLPDQPAFHNHIGGPHAGAMFTLAESASGAIVLVHFGDRVADVTPLAVDATIRYLKLARGAVTATATTEADPAAVVATLEAGERPEFTVDVALHDESGTHTGQMSVLWTLKPARRG